MPKIQGFHPVFSKRLSDVFDDEFAARVLEFGDEEVKASIVVLQGMTKRVLRRLSPEAEELARKREELEALQSLLADRELQLTDLRAELAVFEGMYLRRVGVLYSELDDWNAKIAELLAEASCTEEARVAASQARAHATESSVASHAGTSRVAEFTPSSELKSLYREVAKRVHPDLATDEADRNKRERLMVEANRCYQKADAEGLKRIFDEYESSPDSVTGTGVAADLVRVLRQLKQVRDRLSQIEQEISTLTGSDIATLRVKAQEASQEGRDLVEEMATSLQGQINAAKGQYKITVGRLKATK